MSGAGNDQQQPPLIATMAGDSRRRRPDQMHGGEVGGSMTIAQTIAI